MMLAPTGPETAMPIAIIGMGCRFPGGVGSPEAFWQLLSSGRDPIRPVPPERWSTAAYAARNRNLPGRTVAQEGGFLDDVAGFDPEVFGLSGTEAAFMDPQHRLMLMVTWEALQQARLAPGTLAGEAVGVFVGAFTHDYLHLQFANLREASGYTSTGSLGTMLSNRVSHTFDFRGPSMTVDTACSSSLLSVHLACDSLRRGESHLAVAAGSQLMLIPDFSVVESRTGFLSPRQRCRSFAAGADGYVRSEGVGAVLLKPLAQALQDGDPVLAVIRGSASNQDGHTATITLPSGQAQQAVIRAACAQAGISPGALDFVEAHGTGTPTGDPIEADAIGQVCRCEPGVSRPLLLGACKSVIGHTEAAAGIAGLIKTVLCLQHRQVPANLHADAPSPRIPFEALHLQLPHQLTPLASHGPLLAGVNSFGFGGSNVHVVLSNAPDLAAQLPSSAFSAAEAFVLPLSAPSSEGLRRVARSLADFLDTQPDITPADLSYSQATTRQPFDRRKALVFTSLAELRQQLDTLGEPAGPAVPDGLVWVFPGIGGAGLATAARWLAQEPVYAATFAACEAAWAKHCDVPLRSLWSAPNDCIMQPGLFALQVSQAALWHHWGLQASALLGYSAGEMAAFHLAGVYTLEQAMALLHQRYVQLAHLPAGGGMLAVALPVEAMASRLAELADRHPPHIVLAGASGPRSCILSGSACALQDMARTLRQQKIASQSVNTRIAFHSPQLAGLRVALTEGAASIAPAEPVIPLYSSVTGTAVQACQIATGHWAANVADPIRFDQAIAALLKARQRHVLEISPQATLASGLDAWLRPQRGKVFACRGQYPLQRVLAELHEAGIAPDWQAVLPDARRIDLPAYPWNLSPYWREPAASQHRRLRPWSSRLLGERQRQAEPAWDADLTVESLPWLLDHRVMGEALFPAAAYIEALLAVAAETLPGDAVAIEQLTLTHALPLHASSAFRLQTHCDDRQWQVRIYSSPDDSRPLTLAASACLRVLPPGRPGVPYQLADVAARCPLLMEADALYAAFALLRFDYRGAFRSIEQARVGEHDALCELTLPEAPTQFGFHPAALDGLFQAALAIRAATVTQRILPTEVPAPVAIDEIRLFGPLTGRVSVHARFKTNDDGSWCSDIDAFTPQGTLLCRVRGLRSRASTRPVSPAMASVHRLNWQALPPPGPGTLHPWVVLGDGGEQQAALCAALDQPDQPCRAYSSLPGSEADIAQLVSDLPQAALHLLVLWPLAWPHGPAALCHRLIQLCQALSRRTTPVRLWVLTQQAQKVVDSDVISDPFPAALWGLLRVIGQQEAPALWGGLLDIDQASSAGAVRDALLADEGEDQLALRAGQRFGLRLLPHAVPPTPPVRLSRAGVHLITGGLGAIGRHVTEWAVAHGARHILLLGRRSTLDDAEQAWLTQLRQQGVQVHYAAVDLADPVRLTNDVHQFCQQTGQPILGVLHCAAHLEDQGYRDLDPQAFDRVFAAKALSAWHLHQALDQQPLEYFVLFSSLGALLALPGMAAYAAANAMLDALAEMRRGQGLPALSLGWGPWDSGIAERDARTLPIFRRYGLLPLSTASGLSALTQVFTTRSAHLLPFGADWHALQTGPLGTLRLLQEASGRSVAGAAPMISASGADLLTQLQAVCAEILDVEVDRISPEQSLADNGIDSLSSLMLASEIERRLHLSLTMEEILHDQSLSAFVAMLEYRLATKPA